MGYDGQPPAPSRGLPLSPKTQEVLDDLARWREAGQQGDYAGTAHALTGMLKTVYEPALAVAVAINLVRAGNAGMAPFIGAGGVLLSQALEPLVEHFEDQDLTFEQAFERIGVSVVPFSDLPDAPEVETPAVDEDAILDREDRESPGATTRPEEV